ncbi:S-adenosyl-L-methionine-dependent methyltransferase [Hypomontagnella submonticulosa]|nr:S-adenosyl-L-methionine-dependent methyltransferase [Hypomontagnella submonticulosa]
MKEGKTLLYANDTLAERVTEYAESSSIPVPQPIRDYHARVIKEREIDSNYMISNFEAQALIFLSRLIGAKRVLEIGVYVGYSAMVWSHAIGPQGKVTGLEYNGEYAEIAKKAWKEHGYSNIDVHVGAAAETLPKLSPSEPYDIIFVDADKTGYPGYLSKILEMSAPGAKNRLLRPGGIIVADNVLRRGLVADDSSDNPWKTDKYDGSQESRNIPAIREYNKTVAENDRLEAFLVPLWDGVHLARLVD